MAFIKIGDNADITNYFDDNGKERYCPECGRELKLIVVGEEDNKLVCESCQVESKEELN